MNIESSPHREDSFGHQGVLTFKTNYTITKERKKNVILFIHD